MEALNADVTQGLEKGSLVTCADNTGARQLKVVSISGYSGTLNRHPKAGLGDKVTVSVTKGTPEMRRQVLEAVIIDENEEARGTEIKGPIAREVAQRFGAIASTATMIV